MGSSCSKPCKHLHKWLKLEQTPIYQLTLPSLMESSEIIGKFAKEQQRSVEYQSEGGAVHLQIYDPLGEMRSGFNDTKSVAIFTKGGKKMLKPPGYREIIKSFMCDSFDTMVDCDTPRNSLNKRLSKAVERTKSFCDQLFNQGEALEGASLVSLGGGFSDYYRRKFAVDLGLNEKWDGFSVDLHDFVHGKDVDKKELKKLVEETFVSLKFTVSPVPPTGC
ncbi:hypothetical protein KIN20_002658 [Parelaphostrongylus tenuis]|uniref:Uncharacterized protein n=1 Tax=Parelaphostrongylus tenuis TaxID=148309 RepID=A0AAD5M051_PARTN|nr:hypothetical protein KIN20_002658 [Parelaphostrongylus tenuis]